MGAGGRAGSGATGSGGVSAGGGAVAGGAAGVAGGGTSSVSPDGGDGGPGGGGPDAGDSGASAMLRVVHAAPGAPAVDVYEKGGTIPLVTNLDYGNATPYAALAGGSYRFDIRPAGAAATTDPLFTTAAIDVEVGTRYTVVAEGNVDSTDTADRFRVAALPELFAPAAAGKARVRIIHANPDGPTVDLDIDNDDPKDPEIKALARFGDSGAEGVELPADTNVQVGVAINGGTLTAFTTPKLDAGSDVFFIATGYAAKLSREPLGLAVLAVYPDSTTELVKQNPRIYLLHASSDAGAVDVFAGAKEVIDDASFGGFNLVQLPPGATTLDFFAGKAGATKRPSGTPLVTVATPKLTPGNGYLGVAVGAAMAATQTFQLVTVAEGFDLTQPSASLLRAVHASADTPAVDVGTVTTPGTLDTPPVFSNLVLGAASPSAGAAVPVKALTLGAAATGTLSTLADFAVTTTAGQRAFAVVAGDSAGGAHPLQLFVVDTTGLFWSLHAIPKN